MEVLDVSESLFERNDLTFTLRGLTFSDPWARSDRRDYPIHQDHGWAATSR